MSPEIEEGLHDLRELMFQDVYLNPAAKSEEKRLSMSLKNYIHITENIRKKCQRNTKGCLLTASLRKGWSVTIFQA